jgi:hypothetical protein
MHGLIEHLLKLDHVFSVIVSNCCFWVSSRSFMVTLMILSVSTSASFGMLMLRSLLLSQRTCQKCVDAKKSTIGFLHDPKRGPGRFTFLRRRLQIASRRCKACQSISPAIARDKTTSNIGTYRLVFRIVPQGISTRSSILNNK